MLWFPMPTCPICKRTAALRGENAAFPFCSARCKQIDLGHWLDEKYRVPVTGAELEAELDALADQPNQEKA
jgi:uncharacterized protein